MSSNGSINCTPPMAITSNGVFQGSDPLHFALPLLILQICVVIALTRLLAFALRPLRQPRVVAEIIGGVLLGPSALGRNSKFLNTLFPTTSLTILNTIANFGLIFFLFLVGVELDPKSLKQTSKKALGIAIGGIGLPFALGIGTSFVLKSTISKGVDEAPLLVFMGVALSITAFPVLARILAELKLLTTDLGRTAMSAAAVNDVVAWILLALAIALSGTGESPIIALWVLLCGSGFLALCIFIFPPIFRWIASQCPKGEPVNELFVCVTLTMVLAAGFVTDTIGIHALFGAFVVGVLVPKEGSFADALVEKVEDLVSGLFLPLYFVSSGLHTNVASIHGADSWGLLVLVIFTACFGKILGTFVVSIACRVPVRQAITLGFLMNTKGLVELIVLNIGKERGVLNDQTFAIMVLMALFTTFITTPLVIWVYKPPESKKAEEYKERTIQQKNTNAQLRIMACYHGMSNIPTLINLIEASRGTGKIGGLSVYAMHLMELSERPSAILMVHKVRRNGLPFWNKGLARTSDSSQIVVAFDAFQQLSQVSIRPATVISHISNMHEDICSSAARKQTSLIILPFHKQLRFDGYLESTREDLRYVNKHVLKYAPCSVGILVDRGLGGMSQVSSSNVNFVVTTLFFGGHDDREALSYGALMAEHTGIRVNVIRFIRDPSFILEEVKLDIDNEVDELMKSKLDEEFLAGFQKLESDSIHYEETIVGSSLAIVDAIRRYNHCNLFLVGRTSEGALAGALNIRKDCSELGNVGNLLVSPEFKTTASVLVMQQYRNKEIDDPCIPLKFKSIDEEDEEA